MTEHTSSSEIINNIMDNVSVEELLVLLEKNDFSGTIFSPINVTDFCNGYMRTYFQNNQTFINISLLLVLIQFGIILVLYLGYSPKDLLKKFWESEKKEVLKEEKKE